jgi:murein DD-endopeptidase MepM/ murein hydrolase activator NlpD
MPFPLPHMVPSWHRTKGHNRWFGAPRKNKQGGLRLHAGCDLIARAGTAVYAIDDGEVLEISRDFYPLKDKTKPKIGAVAIRHRGGFVARYCEVQTTTITVSQGEPVRAGQIIAKVGQLNTQAMLHFELYSGLSKALMRVRTGMYQRRPDLIDPTTFLDELSRLMNVSHGIVTLPGRLLQSRAA